MVGNRWLGHWRPFTATCPPRPPSQDPSAATLVRFLKKIQIFSTFFLVCSLHLLPTVLLHKTHRFFQQSPSSARDKSIQISQKEANIINWLFPPVHSSHFFSPALPLAQTLHVSGKKQIKFTTKCSHSYFLPFVG